MKPQTFCSKCGAKCTGKTVIEVRKGTYKPFCSRCFMELQMIPDLKDVRKELKKYK